MHRWVIAFVVVLVAAACGGKTKPAATSGSGSGEAIYGKKASLSWGITPNGSSADVYLQLTDETGKQTSYPLGTYDGDCKVITPVADMKAPTGVACTKQYGSGTELDAVVEGEQIIVLTGPTQPGAAPDPMAREEVTRVAAPPGSAVVVGS